MNSGSLFGFLLHSPSRNMKRTKVFFFFGRSCKNVTAILPVARLGVLRKKVRLGSYLPVEDRY